MKALSLFLVCVAAKLLLLTIYPLEWQLTSVAILFWQDAFLALVFWGIHRLTRRLPALDWTVYIAAVVYIAINVLLWKAVGSPLTRQMSKAAGGALSDSILYYVSWSNAGMFTLLLVLGIALPLLLPPLSRRAGAILLGFGLGCVLAGNLLSLQVGPLGLHRNAVVAYAESCVRTFNALPEASAPELADFVLPSSEDYSALRGLARGRNVALIALESTGAQYLRLYGATNDPTPNLTRLSQHALVFENAYAVYPESIKGLFNVICSRYPAFDVSAEDHALDRTPAIAELFAARDYATGLFHSGRFMYLGMDTIIKDRGYRTLEDAGHIGGNHDSSFGIDEAATIARMLRWIDGLHGTNRFFLNYLPIAGHHPYESYTPGPFERENELGRYLNALYCGDAGLGRLVEGFRARGLLTNTLFIIYGDHGEAFGQHEGNYGHTMFLYEENVRIPLLIVAPGLIQDQKRIKRVASLIDIAPTILDLAGLPVPTQYQGLSLLDPYDRPALFFTDYSLPLVGVRHGRWKYIANLSTGFGALYDLVSDPGERRSVVLNHQETASAYCRLLNRWMWTEKRRREETHVALSR